MANNSLVLNVLLILVSVVWGSTFFIIKDSVQSMNESFIVFMRTGVSFAVLFIYQLIKNKKSLLNKNAFKYGTVLGILLAITYLSQTFGLKYTSTGHSAFITGSAVILVPFLLFTLYKYKLYFIDVFAVLIVMVGLFCLTYDTQTSINKGDLITVITACTLAFHITMSGRFMGKADIITIIIYQFCAAAAFSFVVWKTTDQTPLSIDFKEATFLLYLGIIGTLFCYFITVWIQKYVSSLKVSIVLSTEPIFAALFSYFFINETLNTKELTGAFLILFAIVIHSIVKKRTNNINYNQRNDDKIKILR